MPWGKPKAGGWSATDGDGAGASEAGVSRFSQIIRTIISVVPGGCIRYGKSGPTDDFHTGFWLGVDPADNLAKFSIGGQAFWLKWTGVELLVRGRISTLAGDQGHEPVLWIGADGLPVASVFATDGWGHWLTIDVPRGDAAGDPAMIDLQADGNLGANIRLRLQTEWGAGKAGTSLVVQVGNVDVFKIDGDGNVWATGDLSVDGAVTAGNIAGNEVAAWSGTFRTDEFAAVTVVDGRVTGVA